MSFYQLQAEKFARRQRIADRMVAASESKELKEDKLRAQAVLEAEQK